MLAFSMRHLAVFLFTISASLALQSETFESKGARANILLEYDSFEAGKEYYLGLKIQLKKGWHTYWQNPGDTGLPAKLKLSNNVKTGELLYPHPQVIRVAGTTSFAYKNETILFSKIHIKNAKANTRLIAKAQWLECREVCLNAKHTFTLDLPQGKPPLVNGAIVKTFDSYRARLPRPFIKKVKFSKNGDKLILSLPIHTKTKSVEFFPLEKKKVRYTNLNSFTSNQDGLQINLDRLGNEVNQVDGIIVVKGKTTSVWQIKSTRFIISEFIYALVFALLGGLILNLMPCVLPVLSLKVLSFVEMSRGNSALKHGAVFTFGVLISFWILAGLLIALKTFGIKVGWGFQLQSVPFVMFMTLLLFFLSLNLFGLFEVGVGFTRLDKTAAVENSFIKSFLMGFVATLVATPCTAPFMGAALSYSLTQSSFISFFIFTALAIGMSLPYIILAAFPKLLSLVPKPGPWMNKLKFVMGLSMLAMVAFLVYTLNGLQGVNALIFTSIAFLVITGLGLLIRKGQLDFNKGRGLRILAYALLILVILSSTIKSGINAWALHQSFATKLSDTRWQAFSKKKLNDLEADERSYFLDFTADWCLSCKVNEAVAFTGQFYSQAKAKNLALIKADWTHFNPEITEALEAYNRNSIPVYVLYNARKGSFKMLPEVVTESLLLSELQAL